MQLRLSYMESPVCNRWLCKINIDYSLADLGTNPSFNLEMNVANSHDMLLIQDIVHYMSQGIYMNRDIYMGGYDIPMTTTTTDVTTSIINGIDSIYIQVPDTVVNGTETLLFRLVYTVNSVLNTTDYVIGYVPVPKQPLYGIQRINITPKRQLFRGKHNSAKYDAQFRSIQDDISRIEAAIPSIAYDEYLDVLKVEHMTKLLEMANGI